MSNYSNCTSSCISKLNNVPSNKQTSCNNGETICKPSDFIIAVECLTIMSRFNPETIKFNFFNSDGTTFDVTGFDKLVIYAISPLSTVVKIHEIEDMSDIIDLGDQSIINISMSPEGMYVGRYSVFMVGRDRTTQELKVSNTIPTYEICSTVNNDYSKDF